MLLDNPALLLTRWVLVVRSTTYQHYLLHTLSPFLEEGNLAVQVHVFLTCWIAWCEHMICLVLSQTIGSSSCIKTYEPKISLLQHLIS